MRVLHVSPYFAPAFVYGGPPRSVLALCQGLQTAGIEVEVITTTANGTASLPESRAGAFDRYDGVPVHYAPRAFPPVFFNAAVAEPISRALGRADLCHIHGLWNVPAWVAARTALRMNVPFVISPRGMLQPAALQQSRWKKRLAFPWIDRKHLRKAVRVHATSDDEAAVLSAIVDPSRVFTVPNAVDLSGAEKADAHMRRTLKIEAGAPLVLFLGRLHPIKRIDLLVEAFTAIVQRRPNARLVLAGPDEGAVAPIRSRIERLGDAVVMCGEVNGADKWSLLCEADVLVLCSDSENFGTSVVEALAAGCPAVVTRTCPWKQLVDHECGFWVEQNARSIADAIETVVGNPAARAAMSAKARRFARMRFDRTEIGAAMAACYESALSHQRRVA
ncbi:MAG TPA: glycosyltransferase [Vicinamibacterales bacterium]|jgi:glycosyltransferase involved in cell wall biosynthesis|nr:glycosyltransferase [Vicinamibacterales bacterium]